MPDKAKRISSEEECVICAMLQFSASKPEVLLKQRTGVKQTTCSWTHAALLAAYGAVSEDDELELVPPEIRGAWGKLIADIQKRLDVYYAATASPAEEELMEELRRQAEEHFEEEEPNGDN
jgi:hypothetical protein